MSINSNTVINSMLWKLLERFSSQIVSFVISIILARILSPDDYGIIAIILVFISFANVIIDGGLNTALVQKKEACQIDFSTIFWFCLFLAVVIYVVLFIGAPLVARFYNNEILNPVLRILSIGIFFNSFNSIQYAYISRHMQFKKQFRVNAIALLLSGSTGLIMAYTGYGVWALVAQNLTYSLACSFLLWFMIGWRPTFEFSISHFRGLFDYGWKIFVTNFVITLYENIRSLIIGKLYKPSVLAFFDRGRFLPAFVISNVTASIDAVLLPTFSAEQEDVSRVKQMMKRSIQVSYFFVAPLLVVFFFASKEIVVLLLTEKWLPSVPFIRIFCIALLLMPIQNINSTCIKSLGHSNIILKLEIIKKILEAIILVVSFMIDVYAVAWGMVLYNFVSLFINLSPSKRLVNYGISEQISDLFPVISASMLMGCGIYCCGILSINNTLLLLVIQLSVGFLIYYLFCRLFKISSMEYVIGYIKGLVDNLFDGKK